MVFVFFPFLRRIKNKKLDLKSRKPQVKKPDFLSKERRVS